MSDRPVEPSSVDVRIDGYENFEVIGQGGFGVVYRAHQPRLNRAVAIKVLVVAGLDQQTRRRFEREQQAMGALSSHPAIVTLYDSGFTETGLPYLAMELMEKGSAADHIATLGPVAVGDALHVVARIAD
ncbi:MAG: protein kinase, partial [bacterium]|nr:protein kinase [bacterium]